MPSSLQKGGGPFLVRGEGTLILPSAYGKSYLPICSMTGVSSSSPFALFILVKEGASILAL